jgi:hypothetical protein
MKYIFLLNCEGTKGKVIPVFNYVIKHMWSGCIAPPFLMSILDGGERSASFHCPFNSGDRVPDSNWIGGSVVPRINLNTIEKRKI